MFAESDMLSDVCHIDQSYKRKFNVHTKNAGGHVLLVRLKKLPIKRSKQKRSTTFTLISLNFQSYFNPFVFAFTMIPRL